ncbi:MAG: hypothetical protein AAGA60_10510 [Cyanobacteria bacterium P01_E01_bin.42]
MRRKLTRILIVLGMVLAIAIAGIKPVHSFPTLNVHLLIAANPLGRVKVKRSSWSNFQPARIGLMLRGSDRLLLSGNASATVLCLNLQRWQPPRGRESAVSEGCGTVPTRYDDDILLDTRPFALNDPATPYLLYPRDSKIISSPLLRWNPVEGVQSYKVMVMGPGVWWEAETNRTEILYQGEEPLQPGTRYWAIVEADNGASSTVEPQVFSGFSLLEADEMRAFARESTALLRSLESETDIFQAVHLYWGSGLKGEAIKTLEAQIARGFRSVTGYRLLGRLYLESGLNRLAVEHLQEGVKLAEAAQDWDSLAEMQEGLAIGDRNLGNVAEARLWLEGARNAYRALGDEEGLRQLDELAEKLF